MILIADISNRARLDVNFRYQDVLALCDALNTGRLEAILYTSGTPKRVAVDFIQAALGAGVIPVIVDALGCFGDDTESDLMTFNVDVEMIEMNVEESSEGFVSRVQEAATIIATG